MHMLTTNGFEITLVTLFPKPSADTLIWANGSWTMFPAALGATARSHCRGHAAPEVCENG